MKKQKAKKVRRKCGKMPKKVNFTEVKKPPPKKPKKQDKLKISMPLHEAIKLAFGAAPPPIVKK